MVDTETVKVNGDGKFQTPTGYVPTAIGTYQWVASYGGDGKNNGVTSPKGAEPETVCAAIPRICTTPGGTVARVSGSKLTDSATLSGGFDPTGTITFILYGPGNTVVDTETAVVDGNGSYSTPSGYVPTTAGTYQWVASYGGDTNNRCVSGKKGDEPETVTPPLSTPKLCTTPGGSVLLGNCDKLTDTATLSGGNHPSGTLTFVLYLGNTVVDTETVKVNGDGTYHTPCGYVPSAAGTYQWVASYSGDGKNNGVTSPKGAEPETVCAAIPRICTTPGGTVAPAAAAS